MDFLNVARGFAADALPLKEQFIRNEMPANFLDELNAHITTFEQAIDEQQRRKRARVSATTGLDDSVERGVNIVRQLDAVVRNKFRDDRATLAAWENARRTERAPSSTQTPAQPPAPTS